VRAERSEAMHGQAGVPVGAFLDCTDGWDEPAGEHVLVDPTPRVAGGEHVVVIHRDRLQGRSARGHQQLTDPREVRRPVAFADGFDHFDAHDRVVAALYVAKVAEGRVDTVGDTGILRGDAYALELLL